MAVGEDRSANPFDMDEAPTMTARRAKTPDLETIVSVAANLFHVHGYQNTTMQLIATELGIAKPTLYAHAQSKGFLLGQVFQLVLRRANIVVTEALSKVDPLEGIACLIDGQIRLSMTYRDYYGVIYGDQRELPADLDDAYQAWMKRFVANVSGLIERGQRTGAVREDIAPVVAAQAIIGITGWSARWLRPHSGLTLDSASRQITALVLGGLSTDSSATDPVWTEGGSEASLG
ncbi:TetR/AcrR family transcriptional regulator [Microbacterium sp.]|uniref:TetR/AcrR family transcriptional regulator n=1 Tax=Microbacterium sp. TaxID=51671 RepID=UPI0025FE36DA|nr:TetR/AcrR family transcriptional regulator [Microbacterium sp.]